MDLSGNRGEREGGDGVWGRGRGRGMLGSQAIQSLEVFEVCCLRAIRCYQGGQTTQYKDQRGYHYT